MRVGAYGLPTCQDEELAAQVLLGVLLGGLGLALATPIVAATVVVTRALYVEDVLGDRESPAL